MTHPSQHTDSEGDHSWSGVAIPNGVAVGVSFSMAEAAWKVDTQLRSPTLRRGSQSVESIAGNTRTPPVRSFATKSFMLGSRSNARPSAAISMREPTSFQMGSAKSARRVGCSLHSMGCFNPPRTQQGIGETVASQSFGGCPLDRAATWGRHPQQPAISMRAPLQGTGEPVVAGRIGDATTWNTVAPNRAGVSTGSVRGDRLRKVCGWLSVGLSGLCRWVTNPTARAISVGDVA